MQTPNKYLLLILSLLMLKPVFAHERNDSSRLKAVYSAAGKQSHAQATHFDSQQPLFLLTPLPNTSATSSFGLRTHPISGKIKGHKGIDYPAPQGTPIRATAHGKISFIGSQRGYGKVIYIKHSGDYSTVYAHQSRFHQGLKVGTKVQRGQIIGYVGRTGAATGNHLHYELRVNNRAVDPVREKQQLLATYAQRDDATHTQPRSSFN
ncbi:M23 family metallopeptidase [Denitrificimonas sp. JX-1]|uniref:M23 family metallopeptidase n=2 Tax=Denitrificimonas halotolerans TaxID=3098930 RepID=A0ABU5GUD6_9GAMM|nr:M23 family metallopeptidase [Denitrificimonas sp. JX-1]